MPFLRTLYEYNHLFHDLWQSKEEPGEYGQDLSQRVYLVTGASSGIGFQVASYLAQRQAKVYMSGRTDSKLNARVAELQKLGCKVEPVLMDYNDLTTIPHALETMLTREQKLDGVVHNAGALYSSREVDKSEQGIEKHLAVNAVGPQMVQKLVDPLVLNAATAKSGSDHVRVVWVSCMAHIYSNYEFELNQNFDEDMDKYERCGYSKIFPILQASQWAKTHSESKVVSVSCHPGTCGDTDILRNLSVLDKVWEYNPLACDAVHAASTELYALLGSDVKQGDYIVPYGQVGKPRDDVSEWAQGQEAADAWEWVESMVPSSEH